VLEAVEKPDLDILSWVGDDSAEVCISDEVGARFAQGSSYRGKFAELHREVNSTLASLRPQRPGRPQIMPDYTEKEPAATPTVELPVYTEYKDDDVKFATKAKRGLPTIKIMNNNSLVIGCGSDPGSMSLTPCELFGFNTGDFRVKPLAELLPDAPNTIIFQITSDIDHIIHIEDESKTMLTVCEGLANALHNKGLDNTGVQFHEVKPKEGRLRYEVVLKAKTCAFTPTTLDADVDRLDMKRAVFGAGFSGSLDKLPNTHTKVLWDCELQEAAPAMYRPVKPKMWLTCKTTLQPNKFYLLQ